MFNRLKRIINMRTTKSFLLTVIGLLCSVSVTAHDFEMDSIYYKILDAEKQTVEVSFRGDYPSSYENDYEGEVVIPSMVTYEGISYSVIGVGDHAFYSCKNLTVISLPDEIERIGNFSFFGCSKIQNIQIPDNLKSIGIGAFGNCSKITSFVLPTNLKEIDRLAFYNCLGITSLILPKNLELIGDCIFWGCYNLKIVYNYSKIFINGNVCSDECVECSTTRVLNNIINIENDFCFCLIDGVYTLYYQGDAVDIVLPNSINGQTYNVGDYAFINDNIELLTIGSGVLSIGKNLCNPTKTIWLTNTPPSGYSNLAGEINYVANDQYALPKQNVYRYLSSLFEVDGILYVPINPSERTCDVISCRYNQNLDSISIGESVEYKNIKMDVINVKPYSCYNCEGLNNVHLSNNGEIQEYAFSKCSELNEVILGNKVITLGTSSFKDCIKLKNMILGDNLERIEDKVFQNCQQLQNVVLPSKIKSLGKYCFKGCRNLTQMIVPASMEIIDNYAFLECNKITEVVIEDRDTILTLGSNDSEPLFSDCPLDSVYIGGNISYNTSSSYGCSPFYRNTSLRTVVITDKEEEISDNEFYGCTNLKNVVIGGDVKKIGNWAFSGCINLDYFSFGKSVETIGQEAFSDCVNLKKLISYAETPPVCRTNALDDINKWDCTLQVPQSCLTAYQQADQWKEFFFIEDVLTAIGSVTADSAIPATADIYSTNGILIKRNADLKKLKNELPAGIYTIGGKKVYVR